MIINLGDAPFKAFIKVTYPNGTCTVSLGDKSFTHTGGGTHTFTVNKKGTWTVKATSNDGYNLTAQSTAALTYRGQVANVTLSYTLWLYNKGDLCSAVTGGWVARKQGSAGTVTFNTDNIYVYGTPNNAVGAYTNNLINLSKYSTLNVRFKTKLIAKGSNSVNATYITVVTTSKSDRYLNSGLIYQQIRADANKIQAGSVIKVDISGISQNCTIGMNSINGGEYSVDMIWLS